MELDLQSQMDSSRKEHECIKWNHIVIVFDSDCDVSQD